jgi:acyl-coenzyme A thioesterase PaaI-like protein
LKLHRGPHETHASQNSLAGCDFAAHIQSVNMEPIFFMEEGDACPRCAKAQMTADAQHRNAADVVRGGTLFARADLAFAVVTGSHRDLAHACPNENAARNV